MPTMEWAETIDPTTLTLLIVLIPGLVVNVYLQVRRGRSGRKI